MKMRKQIVALLCLLALVLPVAATETATENTESPTLAPLTVGVRILSEIPESWNPLMACSSEQNAILELTSESLYRTDDGAVIPVQAAEFPLDVTAEFAGKYGIPAHAARGYAYAITLRDNARWEDGSKVTLNDWVYSIEKRFEMDVFPLEIANYRAFLRGDTAPAPEVVSLMDAGFDSVEEAEKAGFNDFYIDITNFWGLETGWYRATDRTKLFGAAVPSGCEEMFVTPAYLYREYLGKTGIQTMFQSEFVGIPVREGEKMTINDVGLFIDNDRLVLVLEERITVTHLALLLTDIYPVPQGADAANYGTGTNYLSCGPYRIESVSGDQILLTPNPNWTGATVAFEQVSCRTAS